MVKSSKKLVVGVLLSGVVLTGVGSMFVADAAKVGTGVSRGVVVDTTRVAKATAMADASLNTVEKRQVTELELKLWKAKRQNLEYLSFRELAPAVTRNGYILGLEKKLKAARNGSRVAGVDRLLSDLAVLKGKNTALWDRSTNLVKSVKGIKEFANYDAELVEWSEVHEESVVLKTEYDRINNAASDLIH